MPPRGVKDWKDHVQASAAAPPNAEAARLQKELQLCELRLSQMQARLMATLDELDASRNAHQLELKTERRAKERLSEKLDRYLDDVRRADTERDEMREVVSILVEKVEACNDYSAWPYARMSLARPLELLSPPRQNNRYVESIDDDGDAVRAALLQSLHQRLEVQRQAHARTKQEADAEILRLRAMVARRDAELEACATHSGHRVLLSSSLPTGVLSSSDFRQPFSRPTLREHHGRESVAGPSRVSRNAVSNEGGEAVVSLAGTRERTLEREVAFLQGQLQQARMRHRSRTLSGDAHMTPIPRPSLPQQDVQFEAPVAPRLSKSTSVVDALPRTRADLPPSPEIHPQDMSSSPSDYVLTPADAHTPSRVERNLISSSSRNVVVDDASVGLVSSGGLDEFRQQIGVLSSEIDAFSAERDAVKKMLARARTKEQAIVTPEQSATPGNIVLIGRAPISSPSHGSCVRERQALREEFDALARRTTRREQEMQAKIESLRQALVTARTHQREPADDDETRCAPGDPKVPIAPPPPSPSALQLPSPHIPSAPRVPSPVHVHHPGAAAHDVLEAQAISTGTASDDENEGRGGQEAEAPEAAEDDIGSETSEQSMELATPLHPTILSLADDDLIIPPPTMPPSLASSVNVSVSAQAGAELEPSDIPLPISPDGALGLAFSPPLASSPMNLQPQPQSSSLSLIPSASAPETSSPSTARMDLGHVPADLLARVESAAHARVAEIQREVDEVQRDLDARTRELAEKNAALAQLRATAPWLQGDADTSGSARTDAPRDFEDMREGEREREEGWEGERGGHGDREGDEDEDEDGDHDGRARGDVGGDGTAAREPPGLR